MVDLVSGVADFDLADRIVPARLKRPEAIAIRFSFACGTLEAVCNFEASGTA